MAPRPRGRAAGSVTTRRRSRGISASPTGAGRAITGSPARAAGQGAPAAWLAAARGAELIATGTGTASRETDRLAADLIRSHPELKLTKIMVSEAGASVYSASEYASRELPGMDVSLRGAVSIARRLQDPLAELVKIDPKSIGVGQYQHDLSEAKLSRSLDAVVEDCVNGVGMPELIGNAAILRSLRPQQFTNERFGLPTVSDILAELEKPGRDPRPAFTTAAFAEGVQTLEDLAPGMVLEGVVTNVAAFGAFVDIGVHQDGLVHVSAMSRTFVANPREVAKPGDIVQVRVLGIDVGRKRISLTLRLDDMPEREGRRPAAAPGPASGRAKRGAQPAGRSGRGAASGGGSGGAMADALRRAGLDGATADRQGR